MMSIPKPVPPLARQRDWALNLAPATAFAWLRAGWNDLADNPLSSLVYGVAVFAISAALIVGLFTFQIDYILFPALSAFMVVGPTLAIGLYEKSRRLAAGDPVGLADMLVPRARSGGQILFVGVLLCLLVLIWIRAAVLIYALFFGLHPFPGLENIAGVLLLEPEGWALLAVGSLVGGLFAAFSFAISVFSIPMLLAERRDAFTAMGISMALVWNNLPVMMVWGAIVFGLFCFSLATGLLGLVVVFPLLGHATWHAYEAARVKIAPVSA